MYKTKRLALVLTPAEKNAVVELAEAEGGLSQSALVRRLIHNAAWELGNLAAACLVTHRRRSCSLYFSRCRGFAQVG